MNTKKKKTDAKKIREEVKQAYAKAISEKSCGCCGNPEETCCSTKIKDVYNSAKEMGYSTDELDSLPANSNIATFGCGNPFAFSEVKEGDTVLDLGPGAGFDLLIAARKVGLSGQVIGVDMTEAMIAKAKENIKGAGITNVELRKGIIEELPVESSSVDWVISNCVINLSPEKEKVFSEIARVLKPGGRMIVSDIVGENIPQWLREDKNLYNSCISGVISEKEYLSGLDKAGLEKVNVFSRKTYSIDELWASIESSTEMNLDNRIAEKADIKIESITISACKPIV